MLLGLKSCLIALHGTDQLIIRRCLDVNEEKYILSFTVLFRFVIAKVLLIGTAVHFDGFFAVSFLGDSFPRLYKFVVSIAK